MAVCLLQLAFVLQIFAVLPAFRELIWIWRGAPAFRQRTAQVTCLVTGETPTESDRAAEALLPSIIHCSFVRIGIRFHGHMDKWSIMDGSGSGILDLGWLEDRTWDTSYPLLTTGFTTGFTGLGHLVGHWQVGQDRTFTGRHGQVLWFDICCWFWMTGSTHSHSPHADSLHPQHSVDGSA